MAWKNMLRYKKRSIITAIAIAVGIIFSIFTDGLMFGIDQESSLNLINNEIGACRMYATGYFSERNTYPIDYLISADQQKNIEDWMQQKHSKINYTPRFVSSCEIIFTNEETGITGSVLGILNGINPEKDEKVFKLAIDLSNGTWVESSKKDAPEKSDGTVLGSALAHDLGIDVGDWITIQTKGRGGFVQTMDVPVIGIIKTTDPIINSRNLYMNYDFVNSMLELNNAVTEYDFQLGTLGQIEKRYQIFKTDFQDSFLSTKTLASDLTASSGIELYYWRDIAADILTLTASKKSSSSIMVFFMFIIAAVGITNTILMSVMERKNEIAMLRTLGYSNFYIRNLFVLEGINIGILGAVTGTLLSIPINWYFVTYGWDLSMLMKDMDIGFRISSVMRSGWHIAAFIEIPVGALVISAISAWFPTHSLLKEQVATIFRSV
jgi:ABC-type lipoprotein release transport system permease subunit